MSKLKDIAKIAKVSISTVSKALNGSDEIKPETREQIIRIARDLKYNFGNRNVGVEKDGKIIGVICPEVGSNYYMQLVESIRESVSKKGFFLMFGITDFKADKEEILLKLFIQKGVSGIIFITENENTQFIFNNVNHNNVPIVIIAPETDIKNLDFIKIDDQNGVQLAIEHLIRLGHRRIAYIGDTLTMNRYDVYKAIMAENNMEADGNLAVITDVRFEEGGYASMQKLLTLRNRPTAVFAAYDDLAIGAMRSITEAGIKVPEEISIIGFDNVAVCPYLNLGLTTISNPVKEMAAVSVSILIRKIEDEGFRVIQNVVLKPELIVRETTSQTVALKQKVNTISS